MGYTEVTTIYNGAVESHYMYFDDIPQMQKEMENSIAATQRFAYDNSDSDVEIYKVHHDHSIDLDCECVQYLTDHHPFWKQEGKKK